MTYAGIGLKKGMQVGLMFGAANHDPTVFSQPQSLNITRNPNPHISFGGGVHYCLGAPLARMELQIAYTTLLDRFPNMQLAAEPQFIPAYVIRGLQALKISL
jgi:cytochrome P450